MRKSDIEYMLIKKYPEITIDQMEKSLSSCGLIQKYLPELKMTRKQIEEILYGGKE